MTHSEIKFRLMEHREMESIEVVDMAGKKYNGGADNDA